MKVFVHLTAKCWCLILPSGKDLALHNIAGFVISGIRSGWCIVYMDTAKNELWASVMTRQESQSPCDFETGYETISRSTSP